MKQKSGFVILIVALAFTGGTRLVAAMDGTKPVPPSVYAVHGTGAEKPKGYVPVMLSNGSLCITVDFSGGVSAPKKERHRGLSNGIFIQGRRMGGRDYALYGHGWYRPTLKVDGKELAAPDLWSQSFDPSAAKTTVVSEFGGIVRTIETFVAHDEDTIAIRQTFTSNGTKSVPPVEAGIEYFEPKHERILDEARRASDYRFRTLGVSRGRLGGAGARWVWVSIEDPTVEWSPLGHYLDHIFHMSAIARTCALNALYANDEKYLRETAYPVMRECARFFAIHCIYDAPDGSSFVCKCTDLERLGVAKERPFMTTCGAIDTLRLAADAAERLGIDAKDAKNWRRIASRLEKSLPVKDGRFAAAANAVDTVSMGVMAGYFPFPIFPKGHKVQTASVDWFLSHGVKAGNMYATGKKICPWYAAAMAMGAMRAGEGEKVLPLLREASASAGVWGEYWEINEPGVAECRPWFMTAAGNCLYAIDSMLLMEADGECRIGAGVPKEWKDWSFRLPAESGYEVDFAMKGGVVTKLVLRQQAYNNKRGADPRNIKVVLPDGSKLVAALEGEKTDALSAVVSARPSTHGVFVPNEATGRSIQEAIDKASAAGWRSCRAVSTRAGANICGRCPSCRTAGRAPCRLVFPPASDRRTDVRFVTQGREGRPYIEDGRMYFTFSARFFCSVTGVGSLDAAHPERGVRFEGVVLYDYGDGLVVWRHDVRDGAEAGPAWVVPFPFAAKSAPYRAGEREKRFAVPQFAQGAKLALAAKGVPFEGCDLTIPELAADGKIPYNYRVRVQRKEKSGKWKTFARDDIMAEWWKRPSERDGKLVHFLHSGFFADGGKFRVAVSPMDFFCREGRAIFADVPSCAKLETLWESAEPMKEMHYFEGGKPLEPDAEGFVAPQTGHGQFRFPKGAFKCARRDGLNQLLVDIETDQNDGDWHAWGVKLRGGGCSSFFQTPVGRPGTLTYVMPFKVPEGKEFAGDCELSFFFRPEIKGNRFAIRRLRLMV